MVKYTLPTGEVVELDISDILMIDEDPQALQEIIVLSNNNNIKRWNTIEAAIIYDDLKFINDNYEELIELENIDNVDSIDYDLLYQSLNDNIN